MNTIAIDIGGTKVCAAKIEKQTSKNWKCIDYILEPVHKGEIPLINQIKKIIGRLNTKSNQQLTLIVGMPGCFPENVILNGSAKNLTSFENEFDGLHVKRYFEKVLKLNDNLHVINDANLQAIGSFFQCQHMPFFSLNLIKPVVFLGIGTGLGGAILTTNKNQVEFLTDGHFSDIILNNTNTEAEKLLSSHYILKHTNYTAKEISINPNLLSKYQHIFNDMGTYLANLICQIKEKKLIKKNSIYQWSHKDILTISQSENFLIGGGIGQDGILSSLIIQSAKKYLKKFGYEHLQVIPIKNSAQTAVLGGGFYLEYCC